MSNNLYLANEYLKNVHEIGPINYIRLLYITYLLKKNYELEDYDVQAFLGNTKGLSSIYPSIKRVSLFLYSAQIERIFNEGFKVLYTYETETLRFCFKEEVTTYIEKNMDKDVEKLVMNLVGKDLKDIMIVSPYLLKEILYSEKITSISFNFYNQLINELYPMYFVQEGIKHKIVNLNSPITRKYNNIIFIPPYQNPSLLNKITKEDVADQVSSLSFEAKYGSKLLASLKQNGSFVSMITTGSLNRAQDLQIKKYLVDNEMIDTIIELPKLELISTNLSIFLIRNNSPKIKVINATKFAQNSRRGINLDSDRIIRAIDGLFDGAIGYIDKDYAIKNNYDITPHKFFDQGESNFINPTKLKDLTKKIYRGFQISSSMLDELISSEETKYKLLTLTDIENGSVNKKTLQSLKYIDKKMNHYILEKDDLIISCKGRTFKTAVIDIPYNETYVFTGSLIVIRCDKSVIDPTFLKIFLDSDHGIESLKRIQTGTTVLSLNPAKMQDLLVPLPTFSRQLLISEQYKYKENSLREIQEMYDEVKNQIDKKFNKDFLFLLK